uniref:HNH domain-containing protein n=1 Tax=viral metagenome TaxID=1070528 RepID=A0A6C0KC90_9ZZZZ
MKKSIPKHLTRLVWEHYNGPVWQAKCVVSWCDVMCHCMSADWHVGHDIPESLGGSTCITNLRPICCNCNLGMGSRMSITEWDLKFGGDHREAARSLILLRSSSRKRKCSDTLDSNVRKRHRSS